MSISGTVTLRASATDNIGVVGVRFQLDGVDLGAEISTPPYTMLWDTTTASDGEHSLTAIARDAAGNEGVSDVVAVEVSNGGAGDTPVRATLPTTYLTDDSLDTSAYAVTGPVSTASALQSAINLAAYNTVILVTAGLDYVGNFTLPRKTHTSGWIVIRSTALASLPANGLNCVANDAAHPVATNSLNTANIATAKSHMPRLLTNNSAPVLETVSGSSPVSSHYRFEGIFFGQTDGCKLTYSVISLGTEGTAQDSLSKVPTDFVFDRCMSHPNGNSDAVRGVALSSARTTFIGCYLYGYATKGYDAQAVASWNSPGPLRFYKNYFEGAGENTIIGGSDPTVPNMVPKDVEFKKNYYYKPTRWWTEGIMFVPPQPTATPTAGGSLVADTTYTYRVVQYGTWGYGSAGEGEVINSKASVAQTALTTSTNKQVALTWSRNYHVASTVANGNPTHFRVYRSADGGATWTYQTYTPSNPAASSYSFTDSGAAGTAGNPSLVRGSTFVIKNLFELKFCDRVDINDNLFENHYAGLGQAGPSILFTPRNQNGAAPWVYIANVTFHHNIVRHVPALFSISGTDNDHWPTWTSEPTHHIVIEHNVFEDVNAASYQDASNPGNSVFVETTPGVSTTQYFPSHVIVNHNTFIGIVAKPFYFGEDRGSGASPRYPTYSGWQITNNLLFGGEYGVLGGNGLIGNAAFAAYLPTITDANGRFNKNVFILTDVSPSFSCSDFSAFTKPAQCGSGVAVVSTNYFPSSIATVQFTDYGAGNYSLLNASPYHNLATDLTDIGADVAAVYSRVGLSLP